MDGALTMTYKDIVKIKGGENNVLLIGTIYLEQLLDNRSGKQVTVPPKGRKMKNPPAGFSVVKEGVQ